MNKIGKIPTTTVLKGIFNFLFHVCANRRVTRIAGTDSIPSNAGSDPERPSCEDERLRGVARYRLLTESFTGNEADRRELSRKLHFRRSLSRKLLSRLNFPPMAHSVVAQTASLLKAKGRSEREKALVRELFRYYTTGRGYQSMIQFSRSGSRSSSK